MNVYGINVHIGLTGGLFAALGPIIGRMGNLNSKIGTVTSSLTKMQSAGLGLAAIGVGAAAAGIGMAKGALAISNAANDLNAAKTRLLTAGIAPDIAARYVKQARILRTSALGVASHERVGLMNDLHSVFGDPNEAIRASRPYMQAFAAYRFQNRDADPEGKGFNNAAKAVDLGGRAISANGGLDVAKFQSELRLMNAISTYTNGRVTLNDQYLFARGAGIANKGLTQDGYRNLAPLMEGMGAEKVGTALMTTFQNLIGGSMKRGAVNQLVGAGLVDPNMVRNVGAGSFVLDRGALKGTDQFQSDPAGWVRDVLMPAAFKSQGIGADASAQQKKDAMMNFISPLKLDRRAKGFLSETAFGMIDGTWERDVKNIRNAEGVDPYSTHLKNSPAANQAALGTAWGDLKAALGEAAGPALIPLIQNLTMAITMITTWAEANPEAVGNIVKGLFIFGVALAAFGVVLAIVGVAILAITFPIVGTGLAIAAAVAAVVAAAAWLMTLDWKAIGLFVVRKFTEIRDTIGRWIGGFVTWMAERIAVLKGIIDSVRSALWDGIKRLFTGLGDWIKNQMAGTPAATAEQQERNQSIPGNTMRGRGGVPDAAGVLRPSSYVGPPPRNGGGQVIHTTVNMDGRAIATQVDRHLASNNRHNTGPTGGDPGLSWSGAESFA
jgi:hypothetical protein